MKKRLLRLGFLLLIVINVSALLTFAYNRWLRTPGGSAPESTGMEDSSARQLCLSGKQEQCLRDIRLAFDSEVGDVQARIQEKRRAIVEEVKKDSPDLSSLDRLIEEISRLQAEIQKNAVLNILREKEVLTADQRAIFFRQFEDHVCPRDRGAGRGAAATNDVKCPMEMEQ